MKNENDPAGTLCGGHCSQYFQGSGRLTKEDGVILDSRILLRPDGLVGSTGMEHGSDVFMTSQN